MPRCATSASSKAFERAARQRAGAPQAHGPARPVMPGTAVEPQGGVWLRALLLWLAGNALRLTILAVPPVVAMIRDDFGLNATQVGLLSSVPPALFAIAALAGSLLVARL